MRHRLADGVRAVAEVPVVLQPVCVALVVLARELRVERDGQRRRRLHRIGLEVRDRALRLGDRAEVVVAADEQRRVGRGQLERAKQLLRRALLAADSVRRARGEEVQVLDRVAREPDRLALVHVEPGAARVRELQRRGQRHAGAGRAGCSDRGDLTDLEAVPGVDEDRLPRREVRHRDDLDVGVAGCACGGERRHPGGGHAARELETGAAARVLEDGRRPDRARRSSTGTGSRRCSSPARRRPRSRGCPRFQNAAASSSVERICASGAVPAGWTGEYCDCSAAV